MNRKNWMDLARALARIRRRLDGHAAQSRGERMRIAHRERAVGIDLAARVTCRVLRRSNPRFDGRLFMRIYALALK